MTTASSTAVVNTVLGPVPTAELGVVAVHEALLSVLPGAQFAPDITIDRAEVFGILAGRLREFRDVGGGTVVDSTGMFHGRDLRLYEALSRATGVHIVASTGMGPEELLGGYFLTPQTNPPTPWPAEKFADLFATEVTQGMVIPRLERGAAAGLITTTATRAGMTPTDESLARGAAGAARDTGAPLSFRFGADPLGELDIVLQEQLAADRVLVGGLDRADAVEAGAALGVAARGAYVGIDHVGHEGGEHVDDERRARLVLDLLEAGHADRIVLASNTIGVAKGVPDVAVALTHVLTRFVPRLTSAGLADADITRLLVANSHDFLTVRTA